MEYHPSGGSASTDDTAVVPTCSTSNSDPGKELLESFNKVKVAVLDITVPKNLL